MLCHAPGFEHRAGFVKGVEGIGCLEEMVGQKIGTEVLEDQRDNLAESEKLLAKASSAGSVRTTSCTLPSSDPSLRKIDRTRT